MQIPTTYLPDTDRHCSECGGKGVTREDIGNGKYLAETCRSCGGGGANSIRLGEVAR
jgi:DnaJ-class molecular chaperone